MSKKFKVKVDGKIITSEALYGMDDLQGIIEAYFDQYKAYDKVEVIFEQRYQSK